MIERCIITSCRAERNLGLADSIVEGVTRLSDEYGSVIVLEDDLITSPFFLKYMNDALEFYKDQERVMQISGYMFPINTDELPETGFFRISNCWGWATWQRAWVYFNRDLELLESRFTKKMKHQLNLEGAHNFWRQVKANKSGKIRTWAIFWVTSIFLQKGLCLHPKNSMVQNIGHDESGVHCRKSNNFQTVLANQPIQVFETNIQENREMVNRIKKFYWKVWFKNILKFLKF